MNLSIDDVLSRLEQEDRVRPGARERAAAELRIERPSLPWYARLLTGFWGWLAALCFVAFGERLLKDEPLMIGAGLALVAVSIGLRRWKSRGYLAQLSLSFALAGEILAVWGMQQLTGYEVVPTMAFMLGIELLLLFAYPDWLMRLLCTLGAATATFRLFEHATHGHAADALLLVWLAGALLLFHFKNRLQATAWRNLATPAAWGLTFAAFALMLGSLETHSHLSLGLPARIGVAVLLLAQLAVVLPKRWLLPAAVAVAALAAFSFGSPGVLAAVALLAVAGRQREPKLVAAAAVFLACFYGHLYYSMDQSLLVKSGLMFGNGLCFLLLWRLVSAGTEVKVAAPALFDRRVLALTLAGGLLVVNGLIVQKERVVADGDVVLVELRPVDPRSLMQGDYMTLRYRIGDEHADRDGRMVVKVDRDHVATFLRFDDGHPLAEGQHRLRYRRRDGRLRLGAEAFFFEEGTAALYANAKYGELRVTSRGDSVLVGLRDAERKPLGRSLRPWGAGHGHIALNATP